MAEEPAHDSVRIVRAAEASTATTQTSGMIRRAGVDRAGVGATRLWMGAVTALAGMDSGPHHHGESESGIYVVRGRIRLMWGEGFRQHVDAEAGDFLFVPPHLPHVERNLSPDEPAELVVSRSPDNIVVSLDLPVEPSTAADRG